MFNRKNFLVFGLVLTLAVVSWGQFTQAPPTTPNAPTPAVPRWVKFSGTLLDNSGNPHTGVASVVFSIYSTSTGGTALWSETQNVNLDSAGKYSVLLGAGVVDGLPVNLFNGDARWIGVQAQFPGEGEQPRILLISVPYAMKSGDAATLGGRPASDYALAGSGGGQPMGGGPSAPINNGSGSGTVNFVSKFDGASTITNSQIFDDGTTVGIGTSSPDSNFKLDVNGDLKANNVIYMLHDDSHGYHDVPNIFNFTDTSAHHPCDPSVPPSYLVNGNFTVGIDRGYEGFRGYTNSPCGNGVEGQVTATVGQSWGVYGQTFSNNGSGVVGEANVPVVAGGTPYGVQGLIDGSYGVAVLGMENDDPLHPQVPAHYGDMIGIEGLVHYSNSIAGLFDNTAGGIIISGRQNGVENFTVNSNGNVNSTGTITAAHFSGDGSSLTNISATSAVNFTGNLAGDVTGTQGATVISSLPGNRITGAVANATNAVNATNATTAVNFSGNLSGDVTGTQGATVISSLAASKLTGTINDSNLSTNVALLNASNAFAPTTDVTGVAVKQTTAASPNSDIFAVQDKTGATNYLKVDKNGTLAWTGTATGSISGNAATATSATSATNATNFTGNLAGDVTGTQGATVLASVVTAGTNTKITYDAKGRVTAGAQAQFSDLGGSATLAQLPATVAVTNANNNFSASQTVTGTVTATNLAGAGSAITSLNASNVSSGTLADARLSTNIPLLNANNTFIPTTDVTGVNVKQTSAASPASDIFNVQNNNASSTYFKVNNAGVVSWTGTANGSISGNAATATTATSATTATNATNFTGNLAGDVTGTQGATVLANSGVAAGTYTKITVDAKGRATAGATAQFSDLGGSVALAQLPATVAVTNANNNFSTSQTVTGTVTATNLAGAGAAITSLNGSNISSGTVADARLSTNVALLNASNAFAPTTDVTGVAVKQTTAASPNSDIFAVQDKTGATNYLKVDKNGTLAWTGTATGSISGNAATATSATSATNATNFTGNLAGDVTGTQGATVLASVVTAGTNTKITYDAKGRVTAGAQAQFSDLGGSATLAQLPATVAVTNANNNFSASQTVTGTVTATNLAGAGSAITSLNASNVSSGTLADARLSTNVALLNGNNTYAPTTNVTGVAVRQTTSASPTADIFDVQDKTGATNFLGVNSAGNVTANGSVTAASFSGNGSGLTNLSAGNLTGSISNAQLQNSSVTVAAGTGLSGGGSVSLGGTTTLNLANTAVTAGTYTKLTVDAQGRATAGAAAQFSDLGGSVAGSQMPALTGDVTMAAGSTTTTLANIPTATPAAGTIVHANVAAPATPAAGKVAVYSDSTDKRLHDKNEAGTVGTTVVSDTGAANNFLTGISASGVITKAQPTFANISGSLSAGQISGANLAVTNANNNFSASQTVTGTVTATSFSGSGASLTNLPASQLTGTVSNAQLANSGVTVTAGTGLSGGGAVSLGGSTTLNLANTAVTAGTYTKLTVDAQGRATAGATAQFSDLGGSVALAQLPATVAVTNANNNFSTSQTVTGTVTATNLAGAGAAITSLNGSNISSGTVADARLSTNVALLNASNAFAPTTDVTGVAVKQTTAASPNSDIFAVQDKTGATNYLKVDKNGTLAWTGTATGSISGNAATATSATSATNATNFTGNLAGDVTGTQGATVLASVVTAGTNTKITYDAKGRVTAGAQAQFSDLGGSVAASQLPALTGDVTMAAGTTTTTLANIPTATPAAGSIVHANIAAPASPAAGKVAVYSDSTDLRFHDKNASGSIGTTVVSDAGAANNFLTGISAAGVITKAQPTFANISGNLSAGQISGANLAVINANNNFSTAQTVAGTMTATTFSGSGASLTNLNASNLSSGTVPAAAMPALTGDVTSSAGSTTTTLANSGVTAGTYTKVTVDAKGRTTAGTTLVAADIPNLSATYVDLSSAQNVGGVKTFTSNVVVGNGNDLVMNTNAAGTNNVTLTPAAAAGTSTVTVPAVTGTLVINPVPATKTVSFTVPVLSLGLCTGSGGTAPADLTTAVAGVLTSDVVVVSPAGALGAQWTQTTWNAYVSANGTVALHVCALINGTTATQAQTFNIRILR